MGTEDESQSEGQVEPPICGPKHPNIETRPTAEPVVYPSFGNRHLNENHASVTSVVCDPASSGIDQEETCSYQVRPRSGMGGPDSVISSSTATSITTRREDDYPGSTTNNNNNNNTNNNSIRERENDGDTIEEGTVVGEPESPIISDPELKGKFVAEEFTDSSKFAPHVVSAATVHKELATDIKYVGWRSRVTQSRDVVLTCSSFLEMG